MVGAEEQRAVSEAQERAAEEAALVRAALKGERGALERLLAPHKQSLLAVCYGVLGHVEDAEDAAQETMLRALRSLRQFRGDAAFRSWLIRIALNVCFAWKRSRRPTPLGEAAATLESGGTSPERMALDHLHLVAALGSLPPHRRAALLLKEWEGYSMAEIGALMGWNEDRVKNELYRARRSLVDWQRRQSEGGNR